ncbi:THUMP domain-containing class I SAM-dependent RNA methyltransferase [Pontibacter akesuensis]|uniref:Putative N6-adenine-specific DNA methylase n=1 Tax=Pontibacter akesuensis TaxID=388950 RepID=A0A1I7FPC8_9BACT|nr:class I SAM-dependent RNA methyltransferase [Pontibacter akesuensis]GHA61247.1 RNA methyltransferase [Pontibacter akesuensis]SFU37876.1 putative N6-adenine-specific DNA methylase [Pontibacter akesuensis]
MAKKNQTENFNITVTTLTGLEEILAEELQALDMEFIKVGNRAVTCSGNQRQLYEANLWCRTAIRVLKPIYQFKARDEKNLYEQVQKINWADILDVSMTFAIDAVVSHSTFEHSLYVSQLTKDAIVDQFRNKTGERPSVDRIRPDVRLNLHMHENLVTLSLDSSGDSLHRRGYRLQTNVAPLNEVLAAGIIGLSGWDKKSPFVDPMCGSGTLLIEAAMMAQNIAPGLYRRDPYGFEKWKDYNEDLLKMVWTTAEAKAKDAPQAQILGYDLDADYIDAALGNIENAGLEHVIQVKQADFFETTAPSAEGVVVMNPPYNERIQSDDINELYKNIGDTLKKNYQGYDAFVLTGNLDAAKNVGLRTSRRIPLYNGSIECRLLKYELYRGSRKGGESKAETEGEV